MWQRFARLAALVVALAPVRPAAAQDVNIELKGTLNNFTAGTGTPEVPIAKQTGATTRLRVTCASPFDCRKVTMGGDAKEYVTGDPSPTATLFVFTIPGGPGEVRYNGRILHDSKPSTNQLAFAPASTQGAGGAGQGTPTLAQQVAGWLATPCPVHAGTILPRADIVMTPFGRVLNRPPAQFDDDDKVTVSILADDRVTHLIAVREASDLTRPVVTNIYGADSPVFGNQSTAGQPGAAPAPTCAFTAPEPLGPFATPKGVAQVTVYDGTALKDLGSAQFVVAPLYTGSFMLGAIGTELAAPTYAKAFNGTDTVIVERETGRRLLYTATYTHFWRKRDLTRSLPSDRLLEAITPMVGVVLNEAASNAVAGVNIELRPGLGVVVGRHFGRVTVLDESTGARVGQEFENRGDVPTERKWKSANFYGLNVDVRAASGLLRSLLGSGK
jgi:hypothetical protein